MPTQTTPAQTVLTPEQATAERLARACTNPSIFAAVWALAGKTESELRTLVTQKENPNVSQSQRP